MWNLHCERRTVCCPLLLGFSWFFPWRLLGIDLGGAGHGNLCHISLGQWNLVSVVVLGVIHACTFVVLFKCTLVWRCPAIFPHSYTPMWCRSTAHRPNQLILQWIIFLLSRTGVPRLFVWCILHQNHLLTGWIILSALLRHNIRMELRGKMARHIHARLHLKSTTKVQAWITTETTKLTICHLPKEIRKRFPWTATPRWIV